MNAPYLIIPIGLVLLILYGISLLFSRLDVLSRSVHRKIWNYGLLATFLTAAVLGTLMAIQINYKMRVPWTETVLKWHVNFGIGMSVIGIFHLLWHWRYYFPWKSPMEIRRRGESGVPPVFGGKGGGGKGKNGKEGGGKGEGMKDEGGKDEGRKDEGGKGKNGKEGGGKGKNGRSRGSSPTDGPTYKTMGITGPMGPAFWPFLIGFSGITFQTFIVRELLGLFQGNELMLSLILFLWLLITGAGAFAGNRARNGLSGQPAEGVRKSYLLVLTLFVLPLVIVPLMYYCKSLFFAPGIEAGPPAFAGFLLLILTPFCFLSGFSFTFITRLLQPSGLTIRKAYAWESAGGATAGIICTLAIVAGIFTLPGGRLMEKMYHPNDLIIATRSGPSGRITITRNGDQLNVFENGILVQSSGNTLACEEMAHFAMIQHPDPRNVLVIGGLLTGISQELVKYPCNRIDLAEPDPQVFRMARRLKLIADPAPPVNHIRKSISAWISRQDTRYDIILVMLPGPQNLSLNRFYTAEFFKRLKNCLAPGGFVSVMLPGTANYVSNEAIAAIGPVINAMRSSFPLALLFPGENNYLIAGKGNLRTDILSQMKIRNIPALYLSDGYFDEDLFRAKMAEVNEVMRSETRINTDLQPKAYFGQVSWWLRHFPGQLVWSLVAILVILVVSGLFAGMPALSSMFIMGAGTSGIEIILLFLMQVTAGSLYLFTGLLLAAFMAGLAAGSMKTCTGRFGKIAGSITGILLIFCAATALTGGLAAWMTQSACLLPLKTALIIILTFVIAALSGLFFAGMTKILPEPDSTGRLYVFDLMGAALGALVYPMVIIPIFGILPAIGIISVSGVLILILLKAGRK